MNRGKQLKGFPTCLHPSGACPNTVPQLSALEVAALDVFAELRHSWQYASSLNGVFRTGISSSDVESAVRAYGYEFSEAILGAVNVAVDVILEQDLAKMRAKTNG